MQRNRGPRRPAITFAESDYRFGSGCLRMVVEHVRWSAPLQQNGETWYEVDGVELTADDREIGRRQAMVKGSRLSLLPKNSRRC